MSINWDRIDEEIDTELRTDNHYTMITPTIAIGSLYSSYANFDIIVNMAYRYDGDGFIKHKIIINEEKDKKIIRVGIHDTPTEPMNEILHQVVPMLLSYIEKNPFIRILVHCQAGVSRSASIVIALVAKLYGLRYHEALQFVKNKRPIVNPNEGFHKTLISYSNVD